MGSPAAEYAGSIFSVSAIETVIPGGSSMTRDFWLEAVCEVEGLSSKMSLDSPRNSWQPLKNRAIDRFAAIGIDDMSVGFGRQKEVNVFDAQFGVIHGRRGSTDVEFGRNGFGLNFEPEQVERGGVGDKGAAVGRNAAERSIGNGVAAAP